MDDEIKKNPIIWHLQIDIHPKLDSLTEPLCHVLQTQSSIHVGRTECPTLGNCVPYTLLDR